MDVNVYGAKPHLVALIHGGPGAPGQMSSVAKELSDSFGVIEPIQTADTIDGQIHELKEIVEHYFQDPGVIIGYSWGAWLSYLFTAAYPRYVKKLILVSSGPFQESYVPYINEQRSSRVTENQLEDLKKLSLLLETPSTIVTTELYKRLFLLFSQTDAYASIQSEDDTISFQPTIFFKIMDEANYIRKSGKLLSAGTGIKCPVIAIHGDYDPHPYQGVNKPLSTVLKDFRFFLLPKCGHRPWNERYAKDKFYKILKGEIGCIGLNK